MQDKPEHHKKLDKTLLYLIILVGILLIAGIIAWFMGQKSQEPSENFQTESQQPLNSTDSAKNKDLERLAAQSMDVERGTDITLLHVEIEKYFTTHGIFPTLDQLNDKAWREANTPGIEEQSLKDPEGTQAALVSAQTNGAYAYSVTPASCDNASLGKCTGYTLIAVSESGQTITKQALHQQ